MKRLLISALFLLFLFVSVPAWATIWMSTGGGDPSGANLTIDGTTCLDTSGDRLFHDTDCDGVKDAGEEFIDASGSGDSVLIDGVGAVDPNFASDGDLDAIRCTGIGAPDASCAAAEDVLFRVNADSVALAADTTGDFVQNITAGTGLASTGAASGEDIAHTLSLDLTEITCGAGVACSAATTITSASSEADFLTSGALTCGAGTQGKAQVHTTPLQYCDNAATPALQYAAYGDSSGDALVALTGDSGVSFFADQDAGTDLSADLEEEGEINATAVTGNASSLAVLFGTGASTAGWDTTPALDCSDCTLPAHATDHAVGGTDTVFPADPNADAIMVWDDAPTGAIEFAMIGTGLSFDGTTLTATATATKWNDIVNPTANDTISFGELSAALAWNTTTDIALDAFTIAFTNDIAETSAQRALVVSRPASAGTAALEALVAIDNASVGGAVTDGLIITSSGAGGVVDAIDVSGADITNAINIGAHPIVTTSNTISVAELILLDTMTAKTGADLSFVTGTAGATDTCAKWNVDGDLVDTGAGCGGNTAFDDIGDPDAASTITFADTFTATLASAQDTAGNFFTISLTDADGFTGQVVGALITTANNDNANYVPLLIQDDSGVTPDDLFKVDYQGTVTATTFVGALTGTASLATTLTITDNESTAETNAIVFTAGGDLDGGDLGLESDGDLTYNPSTGTLTATVITATGNVTGANLSGTNTGDETLSTTSAGLDVSDHVVDLDVTPSAGNATLIQEEDALQVKYDATLTEGASGLGVVDVTCTDCLNATEIEDIYLLYTGGTLTGQLVTDNLGIEFAESDTNPTCAAGNFNIYADLSEGILKKCQDGTPSDLDAAGSFSALTDPTGATPLTFGDTETITFSTAEDGGTFFTIDLTDVALAAETTALLITTAGNNDPNYQPLLIQDNSAGVAEDLLSLNYQGNLTIAGNLSTPDTDNGKVTFTPATVGESLWSEGPNHDGIGDDNDPFEIRQSATPGTSVRASLSTAGILSVNGLLDLADDGMTISSTSSTVTIESVVFTGGALTGVTNITTDAAEINGSITLANDETISNGTNNQIVFAANGAEDLILDLGTTANEAAFSSATGVTQINLGALNLVATGYVDAGNCVQSPTGASQAVASLCANSGLFYNGDNDAITFTLPADPSNKIYCFNGDTFAQVMTITPDTGDTITLNGVTAAASESILSGGTAPESICLVGRSTSRWVSQGVTGTWAEATPP